VESVHSVTSSLVIFLFMCAFILVHCSPRMYGNLYYKFLLNYSVGIKALWVAQHSTCSSPLCIGLVSRKKLHLLLHCENKRQITVKASAILNGNRHFSEFPKYLVHFWCASKLVNSSSTDIPLFNKYWIKDICFDIFTVTKFYESWRILISWHGCLPEKTS
jgi:hypothetical protein